MRWNFFSTTVPLSIDNFRRVSSYLIVRQKRKRIKYRRNKSKRKNKEPAVSLPLPIFCNRREIFSSFVSRPWMQSRWKIYKQGSRGGRFLFFLPPSLSLSFFRGNHVAWRNPLGVMGNELWTARSPPRGDKMVPRKECQTLHFLLQPLFFPSFSYYQSRKVFAPLISYREPSFSSRK